MIKIILLLTLLLQTTLSNNQFMLFEPFKLEDNYMDHPILQSFLSIPEGSYNYTLKDMDYSEAIKETITNYTQLEYPLYNFYLIKARLMHAKYSMRVMWPASTPIEMFFEIININSLENLLDYIKEDISGNKILEERIQFCYKFIEQMKLDWNENKPVADLVVIKFTKEAILNPKYKDKPINLEFNIELTPLLLGFILHLSVQFICLISAYIILSFYCMLYNMKKELDLEERIKQEDEKLKLFIQRQKQE